MPFAKNPGRQTVLAAVAELTYADLPTGVAVKVVRLPVGAVVVGGLLKTVTADNGGTSVVVDVGDASGGAAYINDHNAKTANQVTLLAATGTGKAGAEYATADDITVTRVEGGTASTAGALLLVVNYVLVDRSTEVQTG